MFTHSQKPLVTGLLFTMLSIFSTAYAADEPSRFELKGTINSFDSSRRILIVDDLGLSVSNDVVIKTPAGNKGYLSMLRKGKQVKLIIEPNASANSSSTAVIYEIYLQR